MIVFLMADKTSLLSMANKYKKTKNKWIILDSLGNIQGIYANLIVMTVHKLKQPLLNNASQIVSKNHISKSNVLPFFQIFIKILEQKNLLPLQQ